MNPAPRVLLALLTFALSTAAPAAALTITSAKVQIELSRTTSLQLKGKLDDLAITGAALIRINVDGIGFTLALSELTAKGKKLRYQNPAVTAGISEIILDPSRGKFSAKLRGLVLGGVHSPIRLELATNTATSCALLPVIDPRAGKKPPKKPKPHKLKVVKLKKGKSNACGVGGPVFDPGQALVGDPAGTHVSVTLDATPVAGSVKLWPADGAGLPSGDALCTLVDDGQSGDGQGGDGTFGCALQFDTAAPLTRKVVATANIGGAERRSSPGAFRVMAPLTDADLDTIVAVQTLAAETWEAKKAALGDGVDARFATVLALEGLAGVRAVGLSSERGSIAIVYTSGAIGALGLEPKRFDALPIAPAVAGERTPREGVALAPRALAPAPPDDAEVVGSHKVLIWDPGFFDTYETGVYDVYQLYTQSTCPRFDVDYVHGASATLDSLSDLTSYGTVQVDTHGFVIDTTIDGQHVVFNYLLTPYSGGLSRASLKERADALMRHELVIDSNGLGIGPGIIRGLGGQFSNAIVFVGACYSGFDSRNLGWGSRPFFGVPLDALSDAFTSKGVGAFYGFSRSVWGDYVRDITKTLFPDLMTQQRTTDQAFDAVQPKSDGYGIVHELNDPPHPAKNEAEALGRVARFVMRPTKGTPLVYLKPKLTPKDSVLAPNGSVELKVEVEGADDCSLYYRWQNTGQFGHLAEGDDHVVTSNTTTYEAGASLGTDTITLGVFDNGGQTPKGLFRLTTTVQVGCSTCAPGTSGPSCTKVEKCCQDGVDNDADGKADCLDDDCRGVPACDACSVLVPPDCAAGDMTPGFTCGRVSPIFDAEATPTTLVPGMTVKIRAVSSLPTCGAFDNECVLTTAVMNPVESPPRRPLGCRPGLAPATTVTRIFQGCDPDIFNTYCLRFDSTSSTEPFWLAINVFQTIRTATKPAEGTYYPNSLAPSTIGTWLYAVVEDAVVRIEP